LVKRAGLTEDQAEAAARVVVDWLKHDDNRKKIIAATICVRLSSPDDLRLLPQQLFGSVRRRFNTAPRGRRRESWYVMKSNAINKVLTLGPCRLVKDPPRGEAVSDATSQVKGQRHAEVAGPRTKSCPQPEAGDQDRRRHGYGQVLGASEAMPGCRCIYCWDDLADQRGAKSRSGAAAEDDHAVDRFMRDHQEQCDRHD